ncbi:MAG: hypothetical protein LBV12_02070 [Puniceicoccales bacterium]|jgi:ribosome-associated heat shock protein Hsp15|nr:hypothetical protein [Puniceicoccales bacterium]
MACSHQSDVRLSGDIPATERLDKWLWTTRFFRHRAQATAACEKGLVVVGSIIAKPAQTIRVGAVVRVGESGLQKVVRIERIPGQRLGAAEAAACYAVLEAPSPVRGEARRAWLDELLAPDSGK